MNLEKSTEEEEQEDDDYGEEDRSHQAANTNVIHFSFL
jgi:hypothetical protein